MFAQGYNMQVTPNIGLEELRYGNRIPAVFLPDQQDKTFSFAWNQLYLLNEIRL